MMKWLIGIAIILMSAVVAISLPFKQKTTLQWEAPMTNIDGSPITDLAGYRAYIKMENGEFIDMQSIDVGNVTQININEKFGNLKGVYCFAVTAMDVSGNESDFSNIVCENFVIKKNPPTNLR